MDCGIFREGFEICMREFLAAQRDLLPSAAGIATKGNRWQPSVKICVSLSSAPIPVSSC